MARSPRIFLLRHGQTQWNREGRLQGHKDSALTTLGRSQVASNARKLVEELGRQREGLELVCSPLGRCTESAQVASTILRDDTWQRDRRLAEFTAGSWDGKSVQEIRQALGVADRWQIYSCLERIGGESLQSACRRVDSWLQETNRDTVCITHGAIGRIACDLYSGASRVGRGGAALSQEGYYVLEDGKVRVVHG